MDDIVTRLYALLRKHNGARRVGPSTRLGPELGLDSLGLVELLTAVEDEFGVEFARDDAKRLKTVGDLVAFLSVSGERAA